MSLNLNQIIESVTQSPNSRKNYKNFKKSFADVPTKKRWNDG